MTLRTTAPQQSVKLTIVILSILGVAMAGEITLQEFLTSTPLGQGPKILEKSYELNPGSLRNSPSYQTIGKLAYGKLDFGVQVFIEEGECRAFRIWCSQNRIVREGKPIHKDKAEIDDVFQSLLGELRKRYGKAPAVTLPDGMFDGRRPVPTYTWVNGDYVLMLALWDEITSKGISLTHYRREEKKGEWTGSLEYFRKVYKNAAGKLPEGWPGAAKKAESRNR